MAKEGWWKQSLQRREEQRRNKLSNQSSKNLIISQAADIHVHNYRTYGLQLFLRRGREWLMFAGNGWVSMRLISRTSKDLKDPSVTPPTSLTRLAAYVCATPRHRLSGDLGVVALRRRLAAALMGCTTSHWPEKSIVTDTRQQHGCLDELARGRLQHNVHDYCLSQDYEI